jgi:hypothetical protein
MKTKNILLIRGIARIIGIGLCIFWGIGFVENLLRWFIKPFPQMPPLRIWLTIMPFAAMLMGFLIALKKEGLGGLIIVISALFFFLRIGPIGKVTLIYALVTILPGIMFLFYWRRTSLASSEVMKRIRIVGLIILLIAIIGYVYLGYSAGKELEKEFAAIRDSGCPLSPEGFAPSPIPGEENAILLCERVFSKFNPGEGEQKATWERIRGSRWSYSSVLSSENKEAIRTILDKNRQVFELLKKTSSHERSQLPWSSYSEEFDIMDRGPIGFPYFEWIVNCTIFLGIKALVEDEEGKIDDALETCQIGLHLANLLYSESASLIAQLVRVRCQRSIYETLQTVFERGEPILPQCRALLEEIESYRNETPFVRPLEIKRWAAIERAKRVSKRDPQILDWSKLTFRWKLIYRLYASWIARPILKKDFACLLREWREFIASQKSPYSGTKYEYPWYPVRLRRYYLVPVMSRFRFIEDDVSTEALARACQLSLATIIYAKEKGDCPDFLEQLCPTIIKTLPKDPFTGGDFIYRKEKKGFIVYSVGKNLKDEDGKGDDIVWRHLR